MRLTQALKIVSLIAFPISYAQGKQQVLKAKPLLTAFTYSECLLDSVKRKLQILCLFVWRAALKCVGIDCLFDFISSDVVVVK